MKLARKLHLWFGLLFAPSIIFFAFSGALQIMGLHEGANASGWISELALVHKNQMVSAPERAPRAKPAEGAAAPQPQPRPEAHDAPHASTPLKAFFLLMALALISSSGLGIYLAFAYKRDRVTVLSLLAAGVVLPVILLFL